MPAKVVAFINYWTGKDRAKPVHGAFDTLLQTYIGTGLTHLMFLQDAVLMSQQQQLQDAEFKKLLTASAIKSKLHNEVKPVATLLKNE